MEPITQEYLNEIVVSMMSLVGLIGAVISFSCGVFTVQYLGKE